MKDEMKNDKYYAVLMSKNNIRQDCYLYKPVYLIEGKKIEDDDETLFEDVTGRLYEVVEDSNPIFLEEDLYVFDIISEEELLKKYKTDNLEHAKELYMEKIYSKIYIGVYSYDNDRIRIATIDYDKMFLQIENEDIEVLFDLECEKQQKYEVTEKKLTEFMDDISDDILAADDILEAKKSIKSVIDKLVSMFLCSDSKENGKVNFIQNTVEDLIQKFEKLIDADDMENFLDLYEKIYDEEIDNILELQQVYDEVMKEGFEVKEDKTKEEKQPEKLSVREIKKYFDERIIGQEEAKKDVIQAIYMNSLSNVPSDRTACLLVGPTGSGKTLIAETVSGCFNKPIEIIDTTQLSIPGYVGANLEDFLVRLLSKTNGDLKKAEEGIVVFDEIDKKGTGSNGDISGKGVLNTLLPFIQGTTYDIEYNHKTYHFNTSKLTIFATGAFTDVAKDKKEKGYSGGTMGFATGPKVSKEDIKYEELQVEDFVKYGNMPIELIGRFTTITQLSGHTKESLKQILVDSKFSALLLEKEKLNKIGVELLWEDEYIDAVVERAMKLKTGARSLKSTVEKSVKNARWEVLENEGDYSKIILTKDSVLDNKECYLVTVNGDKVKLKELNKEVITQKIKRMEGR